jgi:hypothetical protein
MLENLILGRRRGPLYEKGVTARDIYKYHDLPILLPLFASARLQTCRQLKRLDDVLSLKYF